LLGDLGLFLTKPKLRVWLKKEVPYSFLSAVLLLLNRNVQLLLLGCFFFTVVGILLCKSPQQIVKYFWAFNFSSSPKGDFRGLLKSQISRPTGS